MRKRKMTMRMCDSRGSFVIVAEESLIDMRPLTELGDVVHPL
jgi:hypothetical protein